MNQKHSIDEVDEDELSETPAPIGFWEKKQRELVTSVVDYNLSTLSELINEQTVNLSPSYQRRDRWDDERQSKLIESFLMNVPVPPIFLNEDNYGQYSVIDGRQRLMSISNFLNGSLRLTGLDVFSDINGRNFRELPTRLQAVIKTRPTLRAVIILRQSDPDVKYEVFRRLNTGGIRLNAQEVRNSVFAGPLNDMLVRLSENKSFRRLLGIRSTSKSLLFQEMRDVELVLRFFTFRETWEDFPGGIVRSLDSFMDYNRGLSFEELQIPRDDFVATLQKVELIFGENAFRRWIPETQKWRNQILAALYDTQMLALRNYPYDLLKENSQRILENFKILFTDDEFQNAIKASVPAYFKARVEKFIQIIDFAINSAQNDI